MSTLLDVAPGVASSPSITASGVGDSTGVNVAVGSGGGVAVTVRAAVARVVEANG